MWSQKERKSLAPLFSQDRTHTAQASGVKSSSPRAETVFWDSAVRSQKIGWGHWGSDARVQGSAPSTAPKACPPAPPSHTGGQMAVNFWLSRSCNKAGNGNCHSRQQCWLAKEKPAFTFKSLVAGKTGTPSKEYKFPTVKRVGQASEPAQGLSSLTGELWLVEMSLGGHMEGTGNPRAAFPYFSPVPTRPQLKQEVTTELSYWLDRSWDRDTDSSSLLIHKKKFMSRDTYLKMTGRNRCLGHRDGP